MARLRLKGLGMGAGCGATGPGVGRAARLREEAGRSGGQAQAAGTKIWAFERVGEGTWHVREREIHMWATKILDNFQ
jgi:hypothetical protein